MSDRGGTSPWDAVALRDDALVVETRVPTAAGTLACAIVGSKATARRVLAAGRLTRAGEALRHDTFLAPGDEVTLAFAREGVPAIPSGCRDVPVSVVYQDAVLLAADKPAGLLVHDDGTGADTLTSRIRAHLARQGSGTVPQAVQRLDVDTTGLVLFSLAEELQPVLDAQVAGHDMRKRYLAVVEGRLAGTEDAWRTIDAPLARDRHDARRMRVGRTGKPSQTRVRTIEVRDGRSLLLVELQTGRRHQIRVHLAHLGHPILGDRLYGGGSHADGLMLHAWEERLAHPATREELTLRTEAPQRFARLFAGLPLWERAEGADASASDPMRH